jgi:hypothetical protein
MGNKLLCPGVAANYPGRETRLIGGPSMSILPRKYASDKPCCKCNEHPRAIGISYCNECYNELKRTRWRKSASNSSEKRRDYHLRSKFGITQAEYDLMFFRQGGCCAICGEQRIDVDHRTGKAWPLFVDHNHTTGEVRELLCHRCNLLVGYVEADREHVKQVLKYLKKHDT